MKNRFDLKQLAVEVMLQIVRNYAQLTFNSVGSWLLQLVLNSPEGEPRIFHHGDAVFFKGEPWWGEANGLVDGYVRHQN